MFTVLMNSGEGNAQTEYKGNLSCCGLDQTGTQLPRARQEAQVHREAGSLALESCSSTQWPGGEHLPTLPFRGASKLMTFCQVPRDKTVICLPARSSSAGLHGDRNHPDLPHTHPKMHIPLLVSSGHISFTSSCNPELDTSASPPAVTLTTDCVNSGGGNVGVGGKIHKPQKPSCPSIT